MEFCQSKVVNLRMQHNELTPYEEMSWTCNFTNDKTEKNDPWIYMETNCRSLFKVKLNSLL